VFGFFRWIFRFLIFPPNIFLGALICLTLANSFLHSSIVFSTRENQGSQIFQGRILSQESSSIYGFRYNFRTKDGTWHLQTDEAMKIGFIYEIEAKKSFYSFDSEKSWEKYYKSSGILGSLDLAKIQKISRCDFICDFLKFRSNFHYNTQKQIFKISCQENAKIFETIAFNSNCESVFALGSGLILGNDKDLPEETEEVFKKIGLTHIVAVSGFQIVLIFSFVEISLIHLRISRKTQLIFAIILTSLFIFIIGAQAPVLRSGISIILSTFILILAGRKLANYRSLAYSCLILLWINPLFLFSLSFQLSILATLGLILAASKNLSKNPILNSFIATFKESFGAYLFTLPIISILSGKFNFLSIFANIVLAPLVSVATILHALGRILFLGNIFDFLALIFDSLIILIATEIANLSNSTEVSKSFFANPKILILYYLLVSLGFLFLKFKFYKIYIDKEKYLI